MCRLGSLDDVFVNYLLHFGLFEMKLIACLTVLLLQVLARIYDHDHPLMNPR